MKKGRTVVLVMMAVAFLSGCSGEKKASSTTVKDSVIVALNSESEPETGLNPIFGWGHGTTPLVQSTLVEFTPEKTVKNDLATNVTKSEDGKTWTFDLRQDAKFTNDEPVTAADVAFTFNEAKKSQSAVDLSIVEEVTAEGNQVVFHLKQPQSTLMNTIASVGIVPESYYDKDYGSQPIGSGPWKFVQWNKGEQIILEANEDYYGEVPAIKRATLVFMDEAAAYAAAKAGQVDAALTSSAYADRTKIEGMGLEEISSLDNRGVTMPQEPAEGKKSVSGFPIGNDVTSNLAIRQALAYGINREEIAENALGGYGEPAYSENDGMPWNNPEGQIKEDQTFAKKLLKDDGWQVSEKDGILEKDGLRAEFNLMYLAEDSDRQAMAMAFANQAEELGIKVNVVGKSWDEISEEMFAEPVLMGWGDSNPYTSYLLFHSSNQLKDDYYNPEGFNEPVVDGYLEKALSAPTDEEANEYFKQAQWDGQTGTSMKGDTPWIWLTNMKHLYFVDDNLDIGTQSLHPHGASWTFIQNLKDWSWKS